MWKISFSILLVFFVKFRQSILRLQSFNLILNCFVQGTYDVDVSSPYSTITNVEDRRKENSGEPK